MTGLGSITLKNFRNYEHRELEFTSPRVVFCGPNGSGKSNLLEAIGYLSTLRSFRNANFRELVRLNSRGGFEIKGVLQRHNASAETLLVRETMPGKRELYHGDFRCRKASDYILEFRSVIFSPDDREIVRGSAGIRRKFFDMLIASAESRYLTALAAYNRSLAQRNAALKNRKPHLAEAFEEVMAQTVSIITSCRRSFAESLAQRTALLLGERYTFNITYRPNFSGTAAEFTARCRENRERELLRGCTLSGCQLDEFEFILDGRNLRHFGSTGQIRMAALMLKLGEFQLLRQNSGPVAVLADDVTGDLDESNKALFFQVISSADQQFFTFAHAPRLPELDSAQVIELGH